MNTVNITFIRGVKTLVYASTTIRGVKIDMSSPSANFIGQENKILKISDVMGRVIALNKDFGPFKIIRSY